jgi:hypothetical protein
VNTFSGRKMVASGNRAAGSCDLIPGFHGPYAAFSRPDGAPVALEMRSGPVCKGVARSYGVIRTGSSA